MGARRGRATRTAVRATFGAQVQSSMRGISSLAKETHNLEMGRDATGATCINQYVVVKTLGRGSFGKVKLCLNTIDGQLYAIKVCGTATERGSGGPCVRRDSHVHGHSGWSQATLVWQSA